MVFAVTWINSYRSCDLAENGGYLWQRRGQTTSLSIPFWLIQVKSLWSLWCKHLTKSYTKRWLNLRKFFTLAQISQKRCQIITLSTIRQRRKSSGYWFGTFFGRFEPKWKNIKPPLVQCNFSLKAAKLLASWVFQNEYDEISLHYCYYKMNGKRLILVSHRYFLKIWKWSIQ